MKPKWNGKDRRQEYDQNGYAWLEPDAGPQLRVFTIAAILKEGDTKSWMSPAFLYDRRDAKYKEWLKHHVKQLNIGLEKPTTVREYVDRYDSKKLLPSVYCSAKNHKDWRPPGLFDLLIDSTYLAADDGPSILKDDPRLQDKEFLGKVSLAVKNVDALIGRIKEKVEQTRKD